METETETAPPAAPRPTVAVGGMGGTISMTPNPDGAGVVPTLSAADLVASVDGLERLARFDTATITAKPAPHLTPNDVLDALRFADQAVADGASGVVLTQGTDTLEESAFLLDLFWDRPEPLVVTGAMRAPQAPGADGPANLTAAVAVATAHEARELGVLVCLNDTVHTASRVTKGASLAMDAFHSPERGPIGHVVEGAFRLHSVPTRRPLPLPVPDTLDERVLLLEAGLGTDAALLDAAREAGLADGIVLAGSGAGHVSDTLAEAVSRAVDAEVPVLVGTRTGAGPTARRTYGALGSEIDLAERGALLTGALSPRKARLLLIAELALGSDHGEIRRAVDLHG